MILTCDRSGERLDAFLSRALPEISRSAAQKLIAEGNVLLDGKPAKKNDRLEHGQTVSVTIPEPKPVDVTPTEMQLDIVYEDEDVAVINKPKGLVVHPAAGHQDDTLVNGLLYAMGDSLSGINGELRPGIVHRIDKDTSGLLVVAKNDRAHQSLAEQIQVHSAGRRYFAVVYGCPREETGTIQAPIARHPVDRKKMAVLAGGREAITHYQVLEHYQGYTLMKFRLETGRTHQIRVHMNYIGHPLFNDERYGGSEIRKGTIYAKYTQFIRNCFKLLPRQALHAKTLGFVHPRSGELVHFDSPIPSDMQELIEKCRKYSENMPFEEEED